MKSMCVKINDEPASKLKGGGGACDLLCANVFTQ